MTEQREDGCAEGLTPDDHGGFPHPAVSIQDIADLAPLARDFPAGEEALAVLRRNLKEYPFIEAPLDAEGRSLIAEGVIAYVGMLAEVYADPDFAVAKQSSARELRDGLLALAEDVEDLVARARVIPRAQKSLTRALRAALREIKGTGPLNRDMLELAITPQLVPLEGSLFADFLTELATKLRAEAAGIQIKTGRPKVDADCIGHVAQCLASCWFSVTIKRPRHSQGRDRKRGTFTEFALLTAPFILPGTPAAQIRTAARRAIEGISAGRFRLVADEAAEVERDDHM